MASFTPREIENLKSEGKTNQEIADLAGVSEATIRRWARKQPDVLRATYDEETGTVTISGEVSDDEVSILIAESGLNPDDWIIVSTTLNKWDGPAAGGGVRTFTQTKVTLKLKPELILPVAVDVEPLEKGPTPRISVEEPDRIILEADQHAPYLDPVLDTLLTQFHYDAKPTRQAFLGDGADLPTTSRHRDHPAAMATPNQCIQSYYALLRRRREAAPHAVAELLDGNHDARIETEILGRAERLYGLAAADTGDGEREPIWSWDRALHLDALDIKRVTHRLGWQHAELVLAPDLVARHGWLHGANTAEKTVKKRGTSIIVGHTHQRETAHYWDAFTEREYVCHVLGMAGSTDSHYAPENNWTQGAGVATVWGDGRWVFEHVVYADGALTWRDRRWEI